MYRKLSVMQLVGAMTDEMTYGWMKYQAKVETDSRFIRWVLQQMGWNPQDGWIVLRRDITTAESHSDVGKIMDRYRLQRLVDELPGLSKDTLREKIRASRLGFDELCSPSGPSLPQFELAKNLADLRDRVSPALALLTDRQIADLLKGQSVNLSGTSAKFRRHFLDMAEASHEYTPVFFLQDQGASSKSGRRVSPFDLEKEFTELTDEPVPPKAYIRLLRTETFAAEVSIPEWTRGAKFNLDKIAEDIESNWGVDLMRPLHEHDYELRYYVTSHEYFTQSCAVYDNPDNAPFMSIKNLPADFLAALKPHVSDSQAWNREFGK